MKSRCVLIACVLVLGTSPANGQKSSADDAAAVAREGFGEVAGWVTKAAEQVPPDKYNYRPVATVRTFGELVAHIADAHTFFCGRAAGKKIEWSDAAEKGKTDKVTVVQKLKQSVAGCNAAYAGSSGKIGELMRNNAHTSLHYGNIITYMRMMGLKPPSS